MRCGHLQTDLIPLFVQIIEILKYHVWFLTCYHVFSFDYWELNDFTITVNDRLIDGLFILYAVIIIIYKTIFSNINHLVIYLFYLVFMFAIYKIGNNRDYFLIALSSILFLTEWYEIPIFLYNNFNWLSISGFVLVSKMSVILYSLKIMNDVGLNYKTFGINLFFYSFFYIVVGYIVYDSRLIILYAYKFICFIVIALLIYREKIILYRKW